MFQLTRIRAGIVISAALAFAAAAAVAQQAPPPAAAPAAPAGKVHIGRKADAKWSATTYEAAASEANKKVLASGKPLSVEGEIVDVSCYLQLGKRGEAHIACGTKCINSGNPIGIVDKSDNLYILFPEEHHPRRDGTVDLKKIFLPYLAKQVEVSGMMVEMKGYKALFVDAGDNGGTVEASK